MDEQIVKKTIEYIYRGYTLKEIGKALSETHDLSVEEIDKYVHEANLYYYNKIAQLDKRVEFGKSITRLHRLFANALTDHDYTACLRIQKEINNLLKLKPPEDTKPNNSDYEYNE